MLHRKNYHQPTADSMKIYNIVLIMTTALLIAAPADAQQRIGVVSGLNLTNVSVNPSNVGPDTFNNIGFGIGGVLEQTLAQQVALHVGLMFLQKSTKADDDDAIEFVEGVGFVEGEKATFKGSLIEVSVLPKLLLGRGSTQPYVLAGPTLSLLLSAKVSRTRGEEDVKEFFKDTDFGFDLGGGVRFPVGVNSFFVEGRFNLGLSNIYQNPEDPDTKIKTRGIQIMAGITFPLGGK